MLLVVSPFWYHRDCCDLSSEAVFLTLCFVFHLQRRHDCILPVQDCNRWESYSAKDRVMDGCVVTKTCHSVLLVGVISRVAIENPQFSIHNPLLFIINHLFNFPLTPCYQFINLYYNSHLIYFFCPWFFLSLVWLLQF